MRYYIKGSFQCYTEDSSIDTEKLVRSLQHVLDIQFDTEDIEITLNIEQEKYRLEIHQEYSHDFSPRDCENIGTIRCHHTKYTLGDEQSEGDMQDDMLRLLEEHCGIYLEDRWEAIYDETDGEEDWVADGRARDELEEMFDKHFIYNMLYLYDHSGITISMSSFHCPWDSGCVGFIYAPRQKLLDELGLDDTKFPLECDGKTFRSIEDYVINHVFKHEVEIYDMYLRGDVWWFTLEDADGDTIDSCGGFFGSDWKTNGIAEQVSHKDMIGDIVVYDCVGNEIDQLDYEEVFGE